MNQIVNIVTEFVMSRQKSIEIINIISSSQKFVLDNSYLSNRITNRFPRVLKWIIIILKSILLALKA